MKRVLAVIVLLAAGLCLWLAWPAGNLVNEQAPVAPGSAQQPQPTLAQETGAGDGQAADDRPLQAPQGEVPLPPATDPTADAMRSQLGDIADAYAESSRFPDYSKPLTEQDWHLLHPRAFVPRELPVEGVPDMAVSIEVAQLINDASKPLPVRVVISTSAAAIASVTVAVSRAGVQSRPLELALIESAARLQVFEGVVVPQALMAVGPGEAALLAQIGLADGREVSASAVISLYQSEAELLYLGDSYVDGAHLVIPAFFDVRREGLFRVQANLMDAGSGAPVSHLNAQLVLAPGTAIGLLRVHAQTLRAMQAPGPYILTGFDIVRSPSRPGEPSGFGTASKDAFPVAGFPLALYSNEEYVDPQAQQRLEFLRNAAGLGGQP